MLLEVFLLKDGTIELYHEDTMNGCDVSFILNQDGTIDRRKAGVTERVDTFADAVREEYEAFTQRHR